MAQARQQDRELSQATKQRSEAATGAAQTGMEAAAGAAQGVTDMLQRNAQTANQMWESGSKMAGQFVEQSMQQFARAFGVGEGAQHQASQSEGAQHQASQSIDSVIQSGTVLSNGMQAISRELFDFARQRLDDNLQRANLLARCRTPQELITEYGNFIRENMEAFAQSARRMMELSMKISEDAARRMKDANVPGR